jgi:predicted enzyme related to lactoylglutathione lyase
MRPTELRVCIDVDDVEKAISFYTRALPLRVGRREGELWVELVGGAAAIDLLKKKAGTQPSPRTTHRRDYQRHWTPVHIDFVVDDIEAAVQNATRAGAILEEGIEEQPYGRLAILGDPFGHGFCLLQLNERGYDAIAD